jgi:hypothetical protein
MIGEIGHGERLVRLHEIEAVVRDAAAFSEGWLGRPDVEAAVDLP